MAEKRVSVRLAATGGKQVKAEFRGIGDAGKNSFSMVEREVDGLNRRLGSLGRTSRGTRNALRNMGLQLNQVAQQGAVTGDYFRALTIQMPDLLLGFGGLGIAIGIVAGVLGPFVVDMLKASDTSSRAADSIKSLEKAVSAYASSAKAANAPTGDLIKKYGDLAGEARALLVVQRDLAKLEALDNIAVGVTAARDALGDIGTITRSEFEKAAGQVGRVNAEIEKLRQEQRRLTSEGLDVGRNALRNIEIMGEFAKLQNSKISEGDLTGPVYKLRDALGITTKDAVKLAGAMADLRDAKGIEDQAQALERLRDAYTAALGGVENMTAEQRTLLKQLTDAALATVKFRSTMDNASDSVHGTASQATVLADELQRAAGNAMTLVSQGLSSLRESEIRLKFKGDPVGLSKALAGARFDAKTGDTSGADPVLQEGLKQQREAYVANAAAVARNQQALAAWNSEQRRAAAGVGTTKRELEKLKEQLAASADTVRNSLGDAFRDVVKGTRSLGDALSGVLNKLADMAIDSAFNSLWKGGLGSIFGGLFANADGNVFSAGRIQPFATGGVVTSPTLFAMRGGTGLMGEAGPEAIMPLTRVGGKLGVRAAGGAQRVELIVRAEEGPMFRPTVQAVSRDVAVSVTQEGLSAYDRHVLPDRFDQIARDPRVRG